MPRFFLRPRWIASHALVAALVIVMIWAGFWQLERHAQRQAVEAELDERSALAPVDVEQLTSSVVEDERPFRSVTAEGRYLGDEQVLIRSRSLGGQPGRWVVTPLETSPGRGVAVLRGWVPVGIDPGDPVLAPPAGVVTVDGVVQRTHERGWIGPSDPADGRLDELFRLDVVRLDTQTSVALEPFFVQLTDGLGTDGTVAQSASGSGDAPALRLVPPLESDPPPHLGYAVQWFIFTTIALIGYPMILRRVARDHWLDDDLSGGVGGSAAGSASPNGEDVSAESAKV